MTPAPSPPAVKLEDHDYALPLTPPPTPPPSPLPIKAEAMEIPPTPPSRPPSVMVIDDDEYGIAPPPPPPSPACEGPKLSLSMPPRLLDNMHSNIIRSLTDVFEAKIRPLENLTQNITTYIKNESEKALEVPQPSTSAGEMYNNLETLDVDKLFSKTTNELDELLSAMMEPPPSMKAE